MLKGERIARASSDEEGLQRAAALCRGARGVPLLSLSPLSAPPMARKVGIKSCLGTPYVPALFERMLEQFGMTRDDPDNMLRYKLKVNKQYEG